MGEILQVALETPHRTFWAVAITCSHVSLGVLLELCKQGLEGDPEDWRENTSRTAEPCKEGRLWVVFADTPGGATLPLFLSVLKRRGMGENFI